MDLALFVPVQVTDMRLVAKAAIVVYQEVATGKLWIDPDLNDNPLFRLGDVKGDTGADGVAGAAGIQGDKGDTGAAGVAGAAGIQGVKGDTGAAGVAGAAGIQGDKGDTGAAGVAGAAGIQGVKGDTGAAGLAGAAGIQGVKGDTGAAGAAGIQGIQGIKGDTGAAGINARMPVVLAGAMLNSARAGVVNGLDIQSVDSAVALIGRVVVFRGLLKLLSTATGNGSMQANIGGMIYTFPTLAITVSTQYLSYEVTVHLLISGVGFAFVRQSIALNGIAANAVQSNNMTQSGTSSTNTALIQFKSPTTSQVTTLFAVCEVL